MRKRRLLCIAVAVVLGLGVFAIVLTPHSARSGITRENFDRIKEGMTEAEVEEVLGCPPGTYTDRPIVHFVSGIMCHRWWIGDEGVIKISLTSDANGTERVWDKRFEPFPAPSFGERFGWSLPYWVPWSRPVLYGVD